MSTCPDVTRLQSSERLHRGVTGVRDPSSSDEVRANDADRRSESARSNKGDDIIFVGETASGTAALRDQKRCCIIVVC